MSDRPAAVKVGPYTYQVHWRADDDGSDVQGRIRYSRQFIRVDPDLPIERQRVVLFHEVQHAVHELTGFKDAWPCEEEDYVRRVEAWWLLVLRENPALVDFLTTPDGASREGACD